jgi:hypothetical protein
MTFTQSWTVILGCLKRCVDVFFKRLEQMAIFLTFFQVFQVL